ncbi:unnamed protein product [Caenorhabditis sp. 36 PRJEB53466]|nr:unnamed protein product [Caenorhabditis sp. 36 PRJEB53466]
MSDWKRPSSISRPTEAPNGQQKWLQGKDFLLEVENRQLRQKVAEGIHGYGGRIIDSFDDQTPFVVISDHVLASRVEKDREAMNVNERTVKAMPALLREALRRKIKIRTPQTFLGNMNAYAEKQKKGMSATNSHSTMRGKPTLGRENSVQAGHPQRVIPSTSRRDQHDIRPKTERTFVRIDLPGKKPEIRLVDKSSFNTLYAGFDAGFSIFKPAETALIGRRVKEFEDFIKGKYEPTKKSFKLDEKDDYCAHCGKKFSGERREHEKTDEHRHKARTRGVAAALERVVMEEKQRAQMKEKHEQKKKMVAEQRTAMKETSKRASVESDYGENELRVKWTEMTAMMKSPENGTDQSTRRRQKRIRYSQGYGDTNFV